MGSIARYIFRTTTTAFVVVLVSLTAVIWVTQALRDIDIMTNRGQSIFVFVGITGLLVPLLVLIIAPIALFIAVAYVLNKLSNDSEIIVMNAAGMSPWLLFRAFVPVIVLVSVLVAATAAYIAPKGLRTLRDWVTEVNANVVSTIVQPGRFVTIISDVTIHIGAREPNGQLRGVFLDDRRNPDERLTVIGDRGDLVENQQGTYLVLRNGTIQRQETNRRDPTIVTFERYALDLAQFSRSASIITYSMHERYLWQLLFPSPTDAAAKQRGGEMRSELFDRLVAPIYPFAFAIIAFAYLGAPRTTRQSRAMSLAGAVGAILVVRMIGFISTIFGVNYPSFLSAQFIAVAVAIVAGLYVIRRGIVLEPPAFIANGLSFVTERISRRFAPG
jgi:lipopolysaccharide export system permease protein